MDFKSLEITRTENARTLAETERPTSRPPSDLRILTVDEWWLKGQNPSTTSDNHLLPLNDLWPDENAGAGPRWNDFWSFEVEKARLDVKGKVPPEANGEGQSQIYAIPGHMDFGIFCVNPTKYASLCKPIQAEDSGTSPDARANKTPQPKYLKSMSGSFVGEHWTLEKMNRYRISRRKEWEELIKQLPGTWVPSNWIAGESYSTTNGSTPASILEILPKPTEGGERPYLFAFDASTPETCACLWFEMAWAFGAEWEFLHGLTANAKAIDTHPATDALVFLQELVLRRLMPARATIEDTANAVFSRQWYSTLTYLRENEECEDPIVVLPFWPVAKDDLKTLRVALLDAAKRLNRTLQRLPPPSQPALNKAIDTLAADIKGGKSPDYATLLLAAKEVKGAAQPVAKVLATFTSAENSPSRTETKADYRDFLEHFQSHCLRMTLLACHTNGKSLQDGLATWRRNPLDSPDWAAEHKKPESRGFSCLTGYGCSGSWLFAVHESSRNVGLAGDFLAELTSRKAAEKRAELGAGLPSRKDFYHTAGDHPVPGAEHLSWWELLRFAGSRARSRSSVFAEPGERCQKNITPLLHYIAEQLVDLLQRAELDQEMKLEDALTAAKVRAEEFVTGVVKQFASLK